MTIAAPYGLAAAIVHTYVRYVDLLVTLFRMFTHYSCHFGVSAHHEGRLDCYSRLFSTG
jgi:hypothetical protein